MRYRDYRLNYLLSHHCCQIAVSHSQRLILTTPSTATRQACVSVNNPPLRGHLSAVAVVKFNESRHEGSSSVCATAGQRSVGCSSVRVLMLSGLLLLLLIAIASPLPNPQTGFVTSVERGVDIN